MTVEDGFWLLKLIVENINKVYKEKMKQTKQYFFNMKSLDNYLSINCSPLFDVLIFPAQMFKLFFSI